jgi:MFS family permease
MVNLGNDLQSEAQEVNIPICIQASREEEVGEPDDGLDSFPKATPIPFRQMMMICIVTFVEPVQFGILFPFVYFMVKGFEMATDEKEIGVYVGMLASSFSIAQLFTSLPWGWVSDRIGRRPVLLIGLVGNAITCTLFGWSKSYYFALSMRTLCGFLNGNVGVVKSMLGEMTDATNRGQAFAYWESAYGLGTIFGPMLGGILVNPTVRFPWLFGDSTFFIENPYLFPCMVSSFVSLLGAFIGYIFLEETCSHIVKKPQYTERSGSDTTVISETTSLLNSSPDEIVVPNLSIGQVLTPQVRKSISAYAMWCLVTVIYEEVYALYVAEPLKVGGLQFSSFEIGLLLSFSGVVQIASQMFIYPACESRLGQLGTFKWAAIILAVFSFALPFCTDFARLLVTSDDGTYTGNQKAIVFGMLLFLLSGKTLASVMGYIPVIIFVNDSAPSTSSLGTVHGCGQVMASLVR